LSKSKIVKAPFVAMSDIRKEIKTVDPRDPKIIPSLKGEEGEGVEPATSEENPDEAINDDVIDGSVSMVIEEAREEADRMLREARELSEQIREQARQEGFDMGYAQGVSKGADEVKAQALALDQKAAQLDELFEVSIKEIQPEIATLVKELVEGMVGHYANHDEVIMFLIKLGLSEITTYGSFIVKVSPDDFEYVVENKWELTEGLSDKIDIEILRDNNLGPKDCMIETEYGTVDASLHTRMESLGRELSLINGSLKRHGQKE